MTGARDGFLPGYFAALDAGEDILPLLAPDFTFALLWATPEGAHEFAGGFDEWAGYMTQREPDGQLHHVAHLLRDGSIEVASGWTTRFDEPLGTFMFAAELDEQRYARRFFAARTQAFGGRPF
jgi:hypothetical protein